MERVPKQNQALISLEIWGHLDPDKKLWSAFFSNMNWIQTPLDFVLSQFWNPSPSLIFIDLCPFLCGAKLREFGICTKWPSQTLKTWETEEFKLLLQIHYSLCAICIMVLSLITGSHTIKSLFCSKCRMDIAHLMSSYLIFSFIFIVQCVPHGLFTAHYSKPVLNTELLISLGAFL